MELISMSLILAFICFIYVVQQSCHETYHILSVSCVIWQVERVLSWQLSLLRWEETLRPLIEGLPWKDLWRKERGNYHSHMLTYSMKTYTRMCWQSVTHRYPSIHGIDRSINQLNDWKCSQSPTAPHRGDGGGGLSRIDFRLSLILLSTTVSKLSSCCQKTDLILLTSLFSWILQLLLCSFVIQMQLVNPDKGGRLCS